MYRHTHRLPQADNADERLASSLLPVHTEINLLARLVVLMSLTEAQALWQIIANENRDRSGIDNKACSIQSANEEAEQQLLNKYFNAESWSAPHSVTLICYGLSVQVDPSKAPTTPKAIVWLREKRAFLKRVMGAVTARFANKTGNGYGCFVTFYSFIFTHSFVDALVSGGVAGEDEDTKFFYFCHGDPLVLFMWHHWDRGRAVPAHCTTLLDDEASFDIGASGTAHAAKSPKRDRFPTSPKASAIEKILLANSETMKTIRDHICSPPASVVSVSPSVTLQELLSELRSYDEAKKFLPECHHAQIDECIHKIGLQMIALRKRDAYGA